MMLASQMMTASPNDVCLTAYDGKHRIIASETSNIILSEAKNIISPQASVWVLTPVTRTKNNGRVLSLPLFFMDMVEEVKGR